MKMIKLEISESMKELHKQYCAVNINYERAIDINSTSIEYINSKYTGEMATKNDIITEHEAFLKFCNRRNDTISIGSPRMIKTIKKYLAQKFPIIDFMLENEVKVIDKKNNTEINYNKLVLDIYGYDEFIKFKSKVESELKYDIKDKEKVIEHIKEKVTNITDESIYNISNILYDKWRISKTNILTRVSKGNFWSYWNAYTFVFMMDIRVCPYCNRQYITPIFEEDGRMRADLDHFFPKNRYPYLSMSIYNLIPTCKFCNSSLKNIKEFKEDSMNPYSHSFDDYVKFTYRIENKGVRIELDKVKNKIDEYENLNIDEYEQMFKLKQQYNYHQDIVEDLMHKRIMYSKEYVEDMKLRFDNLNTSIDKIKEIILGYKIDRDKINTEPLSKLKRDIINQLKFDDKIYSKKYRLLMILTKMQSS